MRFAAAIGGVVLLCTLYAAGAVGGQAADTVDSENPVGPVGAVAAAPTEVIRYGRFGDVSIYSDGQEPRDVVLFLSGDGGWNLGVLSMARRLVGKGAVVAGVDIRIYLGALEQASAKCVSPADDFENLSRYLQSRLGLNRYIQPTLVGYSSGATLVYASLAEAREGLFKGALSIGFCPDLDLKKPLCKGAGIESTPRSNAKGVLKGVDFLAAKKLPGPWISLQGELDQVCQAPAAQKFIATVPGGEAVLLPKVGHGYSVERNWVPQYEAAYARITAGPGRVIAPTPPAQ
jgi:type IV secretory pathway VirJ component